MDAYHDEDLSIHIGRQGLDHYEKLSCPIRYGTYSEIQSGPFVFQFNLNAEIKHIQCRSGQAMEPTEWMKRTLANDWVYYASGGYNGAFDAMGEYYVPCFTYPSNSVLGGDPFKGGILDRSLQALQQTLETLARLRPPDRATSGLYDVSTLLDRNAPRALQARAESLHRLVGGAISVLPPDARHVDYDVIPLTISDGCLYNCRFCTVKTGRGFSRRSLADIGHQIRGLKRFFDRDIVNYNSVFLGQHDALQAGAERIEYAAEEAYRVFDFARSNLKGPRLFLFGSADSLLSAPESLFRMLSESPFEVTINIGLESADAETLRRLGKPLTPSKVAEAFDCMTQINRSFPGLEVTANFLFGDIFSPDHLASVLELIQSRHPRFYPRGTVYLSPYGTIRNRRALVSNFKIIKNTCRLPVFLYIIQRL